MHVEVEKAGAFFHIIYLIFLPGKPVGSQRGEVCVAWLYITSVWENHLYTRKWTLNIDLLAVFIGSFRRKDGIIQQHVLKEWVTYELMFPFILV